MSQSPSDRSCSHTGYPSSAWWAVTPPTTMIGRKPLPERRNFSSPRRDAGSVQGIRPDFSGLSPSPGQVAYVLLSRLPLARGRSPSPVRLACIRRTASVRPEPGSNSTDLFWVLVLSTIQLLRCGRAALAGARL